MAQPHFEYHVKNVTFAYTVSTASKKDCNGQKHPAREKKASSVELDFFREYLKNAKKWVQEDIDKFIAHFQTLPSFLKKFKDGDLDYDASRALDGHPNLRRKIYNLEYLKNIQDKLPQGFTIADVRNALNESSSAESLVKDLSDALDSGDINAFKRCMEKGVDYQHKLPDDLRAITKKVGNVDSPTITNLVNERKALRQEIDNLDPNSPTYKTEKERIINQIGQKSEKIAEEVADLRMKNLGHTRIDALLDTAFPGAGKAGKFDRVYQDKNGKWIVVECKGGSSPIKGRRNGAGQGCEQGTKQYIQSIIENLRKGSTTNEQKQLLLDLEQALIDNKVESYIIRQPFDSKTGDLKQIEEIRAF